MIVVDTSALMTILLHEPEALECRKVLASNEPLLISAATLAEALIVSERRGVGMEMSELIEGLQLEIDSVSHRGTQSSQRIRRMGQGQSRRQTEFWRLLFIRTRETT